ncbi:MAG: formylglycine-generating enzyme family protein [Kiritimatiellae bacterium]|nr:formylglycine-generating enzyme family protein [Kiritimatiellia bacterium]
MRTLILCALAFNTLASVAATVDEVIVRQQWPWSTDVKVEYQISGIEAPVDIKVKVFDAGNELAEGDVYEAISGKLYGISSDCAGSFTIDPAKLFGEAKVFSSPFSVSLSLEPSADNLDETLYRIYNLESPYDVTNVTRKALLNGEWGSVVTDFSRIGKGFNTTLKDVVIWTGVTNDVKYKTTHLVMRKIPASGKEWKIGAPDGELGRVKASEIDETQHTVKLSSDYFIGVFEVTQAQYKKYAGYIRTPVHQGDLLPMENDHYQGLRGKYNGTTELDPYGEVVNWPTNSFLHTVYSNSDIGHLRNKTKIMFDLPTEAQWEFACRAGTTNALNSGKELTKGGSFYWKDDSEAFNEVGWCLCSSNPDKITQEVGLKKPNAFGLYDMHGNVGEACVNWCGAVDAGQEGNSIILDPLGPTTGLGGCRTARGEGVNNYASKNRAASRTQIGPSTPYAYIGFRFVCPEGDVW